uniref:Sodium-independent sulfate anion transporter-like n=1 Tax=Phallusia mammillata TaxID=59560 RepID=A0A6F9DT52_9ASCI|nr:sodium-independent sulfate anion transporter-like [Phallusia mammillata]
MSLHSNDSDIINEESALIPKKNAKARCNKIGSVVKSFFPFTTWAPKYNLKWLQCDLIAGLTVGLTVIPQGLAYSQIANLPVQYGLYSAFMGGFIYCIFGTSKDITLGPTAIMSLLVRTYGNGDPVQVIMLTLLSGCIQLAMGMFHLGFIMWFLSAPVVSGFTSAAAITIGFGQVKHILGVSTNSSSFIPEVIETFKNIPQANVWDILLGVSCIILLILLRYVGKEIPDSMPDTSCQSVARKFVWYVTIGRNAVIVICAAAIAYAIHTQKITTCKVTDCLTLTGEIKKGLPSFKPPAFSETEGNTTVSTGALMKNIGAGFVIVPLMGILESVAIGKAFARKNNYKLDLNQEIIAIGAANIISSFVSSYAITGSFSRTAINAQSGVKTPAGGIFTGCVVIIGLAVLTPLFYFIPKAALAAVIISAVVFMIDIATVKKLWYTKKLDLLPLVVTFLVCFWQIPYGILAGVATSIAILLYPVTVPTFENKAISVAEDGDDKTFLIVKIKNGLNFPSAEYTNRYVKKSMEILDNVATVILDFQQVTTYDYSVIQAICELAEDLQKEEVNLVVVSAQEDIRTSIVNICENGIITFLGDLEEAVPTV